MDWVTGLGNFVNGLIRTHKMNEWFKLCLGIALSYLLTGSLGAGGAIVKALHDGLSPSACMVVGVATFLISGAGAALFVFVRNPLSKGVMIAVPSDLAVQAETEQKLVTITPQKQ